MQLAQSPLLSAYAGLIAPTVILSELLISGLLSFRTTRLVGLYASYLLMISFTAYIYLMINYSEFIPCSCGEIIEKLSWTEHLVFNSKHPILQVPFIYEVDLSECQEAEIIPEIRQPEPEQEQLELFFDELSLL